MNWERVRALGELQILTRASYATLIVVPVLAALWPAVRIAANRYNETLAAQRREIDVATERLQAATVQAPGDVGRIDVILEQMQTQIIRIREDYGLPPIEDAALPDVWVYAFFAALAVVFGHTVYQISAPAMVRQRDMQGHVDDAVRRYREDPSKSRLEDAKDLISAKGADVFDRFIDRELKSNGLELSKKYEELKPYLEKNDESSSGPGKLWRGAERGQERRQMIAEVRDRVVNDEAYATDVVMIAASVEYRVQSERTLSDAAVFLSPIDVFDIAKDWLGLSWRDYGVSWKLGVAFLIAPLIFVLFNLATLAMKLFSPQQVAFVLYAFAIACILYIIYRQSVMIVDQADFSLPSFAWLWPF